MIDDRTGLIVIDVQWGFDEPVWGPRNNPDAEANIAALLRHWRERGRPIFHVRHDSRYEDNSLHPSHPGNRVKPEAEPWPEEPVYPKTAHSAFIGTTLERDLRSAGIQSVVIVGITTNHCVSTTTRMAGDFGFATYVVSDATATFERAGLDGRIRPAEEVHASALSDLNEEFATVIETAALLGDVQR